MDNSPRGSKQHIFWIIQSTSALDNSIGVSVQFLFNHQYFNNMSHLFLSRLLTSLFMQVSQKVPPSWLTFWNIFICVSSSVSLPLQPTQALIIFLLDNYSQFPTDPSAISLCPIISMPHTPTHWSCQSPGDCPSHCGLMGTFLIWALSPL